MKADYISKVEAKEKVMTDILEIALDDEDIQMVIWLLKNDSGLMDHELTDSSTLKERLIQLNEYHYVLSKLK
jgi:hypothetical protein